MKGMKAKISKRGKKQALVLELPLASEGRLSASGQGCIVAETRGNVETGLLHPTTGEEIVVGVYAFTRTEAGKESARRNRATAARLAQEQLLGTAAAMLAGLRAGEYS